MMADDELTFASAGVAGVHYARCWACMTGGCPGGMHDWADADDIGYAKATGQPSPVGKRCGCSCADGPVLDDDPPDFGLDSLDAPPCPVCEATGACAWDADGRPLIHTIGEDD